MRARFKIAETVVILPMDKHKFLNGNPWRARVRRGGHESKDGGHGARTRFNRALEAARTSSMFISLEIRHLAWDSKNLFFIFYISVGWPSSLFRPNNLKKKLTPNFADRFGQSGRPNSLPARPRES